MKQHSKIKFFVFLVTTFFSMSLINVNSVQAETVPTIIGPVCKFEHSTAQVNQSRDHFQSGLFDSEPGLAIDFGANLVEPTVSPYLTCIDNVAIASFSGTVTTITHPNPPSFGNHIELVSNDGTLKVIYAHLDSYLVGNGHTVVQGQAIGIIGTSGLVPPPPPAAPFVHLHMEVEFWDSAVSDWRNYTYGPTPSTNYSNEWEFGTYRTWSLNNSNTVFGPLINLNFAAASDIPIAGDWDGDGIDTVGVFRSYGASWFLRASNDPNDNSGRIDFNFGSTGDIPIVGDWDGDGIDTVGVFRPSNPIHPSNPTWYLNPNNAHSDNTNLIVFQFGLPGDIPIVGDWDGDGTDTVGVFRPSNATWYLNPNNAYSDNTNLIAFQFGSIGDIPVVGDWNGDGTDTVGVFRPSNATWYLNPNNAYSDNTNLIVMPYGYALDNPLVGNWDEVDSNNNGTDTVAVTRAK